MKEPREVQLDIMAHGHKDIGTLEDEANSFPNQSTINGRERQRSNRWLRITLYTVFVLSGQSAATLLGSLYYEKGGKSKWMGSLVQLVGFPILLPYYIFSPSPSKNPIQNPEKRPSVQKLAFVYVVLGLLGATNCYTYSLGLSYLPVSTLSLICSSQLAFNAFFSFFLNSLHFTPCIINSLVLLTISSILLVFETDSAASDSSTQISKGKYVTGFMCALASAAGYGLNLSLTQLAFKKVIKRETFRAIMDMIVCLSIVATSATLVGLFASGEWKELKREMEEYEMGKTSYVLTLTWTAISWSLFTIGSVGLISEVSALFSNAISVLGLPVVPILATIFFQDKMHGIKAISLVLAVWGFVSYGYQQSLDDRKSNSATETETPSDEFNR
ncbi:hypothetical protein K1719_008533 [Acacia pycnantha]|nr:hypothetical protein K1719_008533 [Acacia pycnantha]